MWRQKTPRTVNAAHGSATFSSLEPRQYASQNECMQLHYGKASHVNMRELYNSYKHRDSTTILWRKWCINCSFPQSKLANVGETETCFPWRKFTWIWESNRCWTGSPKSFDLDCLITNHGRTEEPSTSKRHCAASRDPNILDQKSIHEVLTVMHGWQAGSGVRMIENVIRWLLTFFGPRGVGCVDASGASKGSAPELGSWSRSVKAHWQKPIGTSELHNLLHSKRQDKTMRNDVHPALFRTWPESQCDGEGQSKGPCFQGRAKRKLLHTCTLINKRGSRSSAVLDTVIYISFIYCYLVFFLTCLIWIHACFSQWRSTLIQSTQQIGKGSPRWHGYSWILLDTCHPKVSPGHYAAASQGLCSSESQLDECFWGGMSPCKSVRHIKEA